MPDIINTPDARKWVKLTFDPDRGASPFEYEDGYGNQLSENDIAEYRRVIINEESKIFLDVPVKIDTYLQEMLRAAPLQHETRNGLKIFPLAVYIAYARRPRYFLRRNYQELLNPEFLFSRLFGHIVNGGECQIISFIDSGPTNPFSLPLNIYCYGPEAEALRQVISGQRWFVNNPSVATHGLNLRTDIPSNPTEEDVDIIVVQDIYTERLFFEYWWSRGVIPRLLIVIDPYPYDVFREESIRMLGIPCILIRYRNSDAVFYFFEEFIYSLVHDFPLHEAVHHSLREFGSGRVEVSLFASPESNQCLRLSAALESFKVKMNNYEKVIKSGNTEAFLNKFRNYSADIQGKLFNAMSDQGSETGFFNRTRDLNIYFHGESTGLVPMSNQLQELSRYQSRFEQIKTGLQSLVNDDEVFNALREMQERRVDITLDEYNASLIYAPINSNFSLRTRAQYRLNVTIGQLSQHSLMTGEIPAIDPLLPDPENAAGHELEIVVFPLDFKLQSASYQTLYLPLLGGTDQISFDLTAPDQPGAARLRVNVFHKNHLLQAFLLQAIVEEGIRYHETAAVTVSLDLSTTSRFTNFTEATGRDLFIGFNSNGSGTHTFFVKKDTTVREVTGITEKQMDDIQTEFKQLLTDAYFNPNGSLKFSPYNVPGIPKNAEFFNQIIKFARFGYKLYSYLASANDTTGLWDKFMEIKDASNKEIQIGRHNPIYSFPWSVLYDYDLPTEFHGVNDYPVCTGEKFQDGQWEAFSKKGFGCPHNPDIQTFCVEGFWGVRHRIEQVFGSAQPTDFEDKVFVNENPRIFYSYNIDDADSKKMVQNITQYPNVLRIDAQQNLMDLLWDAGKRPAALVVFGHLETLKKDLEPVGARIITFPKEEWPPGRIIPDEKWILPSELFKYCSKRKKWEGQPLPVVFLINCSSAEFTVASYNTIVKGFHTAGAAAIVGTECDITTGMGARFIEEVLNAVYKNDMRLGQAIQQFNKNLISSGIPMAFMFSCYGNINLKISNQ